MIGSLDIIYKGMLNGGKLYMREQIIEDIEKALGADAYLSALALAITIPDFCGKYYIEKVEKSNKAECSKYRYEQWYKKFFLRNDNKEDAYYNEKQIQKPSQLTCEQCYGLRCSFLHAMDTDIANQRVMRELPITEVKINKGNITIYLEADEENPLFVDISIRGFAQSMIRSYRRFLKEYPKFDLKLEL